MHVQGAQRRQGSSPAVAGDAHFFRMPADQRQNPIPHLRTFVRLEKAFVHPHRGSRITIRNDLLGKHEITAPVPGGISSPENDAQGIRSVPMYRVFHPGSRILDQPDSLLGAIWLHILIHLCGQGQSL